MSWINHLPPACWSTFWKSNFKQQLGCRFDIMDNESYFFVCFDICNYMSWYIRSFFGFTFLNILYFFKYSCTNIFHRRNLYTFYSNSITLVIIFALAIQLCQYMCACVRVSVCDCKCASVRCCVCVLCVCMYLCWTQVVNKNYYYVRACVCTRTRTIVAQPARRTMMIFSSCSQWVW